MPRLVLKLMKNHDAHLYRAATAVEAGGLAYATMTDMLPMMANQPPMVKAAIAAAIWFGYSEFVDNLTV